MTFSRFFIADVLKGREELFRHRVSENQLTFNTSGCPYISIPARTDHANCMHGRCLYVFGGFKNEGQAYNDLWKVDMTLRKVKRIQTNCKGLWLYAETFLSGVVWCDVVWCGVRMRGLYSYTFVCILLFSLSLSLLNYHSKLVWLVKKFVTHVFNMQMQTTCKRQCYCSCLKICKKGLALGKLNMCRYFLVTYYIFFWQKIRK